MKKLLCLFICAALLLGLAAGCGNNGGASSAPPASSAATEDASSGGEEAPAPEERITLRILGFTTTVGDFPEGQDENHNFIVDFLTANMPYDFEFTFVDGGDQRNAMIAAGSEFDLLKLSSSAELLKLVQQDYLTPVDEFLTDKPELMNPAQISKALWNIARVDGITYGVPQEWSDPYVGFAMRVDWIKDMGLQTPKTLDELTNVLRAFRDDDPNGDGANVIPFTACWGKGTALEFFRAIYGIHLEYMPIDDQITFVYATDKGKDMINYMAGWYAEGLMDPEIAVANEETASQRLFTGQLGSMYVPWWTMKAWDTVLLEDMGFEDSPFWWVAPPSGPDGKTTLLKEYGPIEHIMTYPKNGNAKAGVDFSERLITPEIADFVQFGIEGTHWNWDDSSKTSRHLTEEYDNITWRWYYGDNLGYRLDLMREHINLEYGKWREPVQQWGGGVATSALLIPAVQGIDEIVSNVGDYFWNEIGKFVMGERPMSEYDNFIAELKNLGLDEVVDKTQAVYDEYK